MSSSLDCGCEDKFMNREHLGETDSPSAAIKLSLYFGAPVFSGFVCGQFDTFCFFKTSSGITVLY